MVAAKPDCTGQRFGWLTVKGKGEVVKANGKSRRLWILECDCGKKISLQRGDFDRSQGGQKSCGCARSKGWVDNKRIPDDITGQKFGSLTAIRLTGKKVKGQPTWLLECDCGKECEMSKKRLGQGYRLNCGDLSHQPGVHYPPTPNPYPEQAGAIVVKYLHLTHPKAPIFDSRIQDRRLDRLIRAAWILTYREWQGETFSDLYKYRFICKHLRYSATDIKLQRYVESGGVSRYTFNRYKTKGIGGMMTDLTSSSEVVSTQGKTQPEVTLSIRGQSLKPRRVKFKRC